MSSTSPKPVPPFGWKSVRSVLLCGASVRSLAESTIAAGFHPLCVDFFEDQDLKHLLGSGRGRFVGRIDSFRQIPAAIRSVRKSIPLLWAGGLENHTDILRDISQNRPVIGADLASVDQLRDPWKLQHWLSEAKIIVPRLATEATTDADCHWLRKSAASSGGLGIGHLPATGQGVQPMPTHDVYLQEYIDGVPMSAAFCVDERGLHLFGMSLQLTGWPGLGASDFLFCGNLGPVHPGEEVTHQVMAMAQVLIDRCSLRGVFGIDFILRQGRVWLLEVNPRLTASHMLYELQQPGLLVHRHLAALGWKCARPRRSLESSRAQLFPAPSPVSARLIFWAQRDVCIPPQFGESFHADQPNSMLRIADRPAPGFVVKKSSPLCSLHVTSSDFESLERQLITLEQGRRESQSRSGDELFKMGFSTLVIATQLQMLRRKFERNCG